MIGGWRAEKRGAALVNFGGEGPDEDLTLPNARLARPVDCFRLFSWSVLLRIWDGYRYQCTLAAQLGRRRTGIPEECSRFFLPVQIGSCARKGGKLAEKHSDLSHVGVLLFLRAQVHGGCWPAGGPRGTYCAAVAVRIQQIAVTVTVLCTTTTCYRRCTSFTLPIPLPNCLFSNRFSSCGPPQRQQGPTCLFCPLFLVDRTVPYREYLILNHTHSFPPGVSRK